MYLPLKCTCDDVKLLQIYHCKWFYSLISVLLVLICVKVVSTVCNWHTQVVVAGFWESIWEQAILTYSYLCGLFIAYCRLLLLYSEALISFTLSSGAIASVAPYAIVQSHWQDFWCMNHCFMKMFNSDMKQNSSWCDWTSCKEVTPLTFIP